MELLLRTLLYIYIYAQVERKNIYSSAIYHKPERNEEKKLCHLFGKQFKGEKSAFHYLCYEIIETSLETNCEPLYSMSAERHPQLFGIFSIALLAHVTLNNAMQFVFSTQTLFFSYTDPNRSAFLWFVAQICWWTFFLNEPFFILEISSKIKLNKLTSIFVTVSLVEVESNLTGAIRDIVIA